MNIYCRLSDVKSRLRIAGTSSDADLLWNMEMASRLIESFTNRKFYLKRAVKYFDIPVGWSSKPLFIPDVYTIITLSLDRSLDRTYSTEISVDDIYRYPSNEMYCMKLIPSGFVWPVGLQTVKLDAEWGYLSRDPWKSTTWTIDIESDIAETGTISPGNSAVEAGMTILVGEERMYVSAIEKSALFDIATLLRGINGTTAGGPYVGALVSIGQYDEIIEKMTVLIAARLFNTSGSEGIRNESLGTRSITYFFEKESSSGLTLIEENALARFVRTEPV